MSAADYTRLVLLAAIWGGSYIFMRVAAPAFGPVWTAEGRLLIAGLVLAAWFRFSGFEAGWRRHWKPYLAIGLVNMALPSLFYAFALQYIPAAIGVVLNSTSPIFGAGLAALLLKERFSASMALGCAAGFAGVALVVQPGALETSPMFVPSVLACLAACLCYGYNGVVMRRYAADVPSRGIAVAGQLAAAAMLLPLAPLVPPPGAIGGLELGNLLALGLLGNALGFVLYFRLIADVGATRALTVTYLMPLFGLVWGYIFLGEALPPSALAGVVLILAGTALVTRR
jgi:drug/metabolite transporter (DMT)-like permease